MKFSRQAKAFYKVCCIFTVGGSMRKLIIAFCVFAAAAFSHAAPPATLKTPSAVTTTPASAERPWLLQDEKNNIDVFSKAADAVVNVNSTMSVRALWSSETFEVPAGAGTGFLWDQEGHIVTNYHVIQSARRSKTVSVVVRSGKTIPAKILGFDARKDVAVLKLSDTKNLPEGFSSRLADSSQLQVGQKTLAIGNPFELSHTLTTGVISALNRTVPSPVENLTNRDMIQTDAAINPGNSGGPLMDSRGYLIGMTSSIFSQSGNSAGVGFAVPSNSIKRIVNQIIKNGKVQHPGLGIVPLPQRFADYLKVEGVVIRETMAKGGAEKAGLRESRINKNNEPEFGDIITAIDGKPVKEVDDIFSHLEEKNVGDTVKVDYIRNGKKASTSVTLTSIQE